MRFINIEFYSILFPPSYLHVTLVQNILLEFTLLSTSTTQQTNPTLIDDNISFQQFHVTFLHNHLYFSPLLSSLTLFSTPLRLTSFLSFSLSFLLFSFLFSSFLLICDSPYFLLSASLSFLLLSCLLCYLHYPRISISTTHQSTALHLWLSISQERALQ